MLTILSLVTSVKDYIEVLHKLIETDSMNGLNSYYDFGAGTTFLVLATKEILSNFFSLKWLQTIWSIPTLVPDIASAMISEISIFNGFGFAESFQNSMTLLEQPISYGNQNLFFYCLEKFMIGAMNSVFLFLPTSTAHIITLRRFVMQGLEAGYIAGLGTIAGNFVWIGSVIFGLRFLVIPWLSFDILRYLLGFILLVKYMWDSYSERHSVLDALSKSKIFLLNFLLAFTEQTNLFPFLSNISIGSDSTLLETFPSLSASPSSNIFEFFMIHGFYLIGILVGSLSLLQLACWFWENPAYNFYIWIISSFKVTTTFYYKFLNFLFLYLTMICAISNVTYLGLDYTITNPLGFTHEDRLVEQKVLLETSFLNSKASDRNTRRNRGRHGRRERWKRRVRRYRTFDASLYDQGTYDLFTIEDLNYGFDRFWLRRKIRNHRVRFRFFPGPWMRSFKKQLTRPRLESFMGPRIEFFRILFEQAYHSEFHEFKNKASHSIRSHTSSRSALSSIPKMPKRSGGEGAEKNVENTISNENISSGLYKMDDSFGKAFASAKPKRERENEKIMIPLENFKQNQRNVSIYFDQKLKEKKENIITQNSALRKFLRKTENRVQLAKIQQQLQKTTLRSFSEADSKKAYNFMKSETTNLEPIYSKRWKYLFSKIAHNSKKANLKLEQTLLEKFYKNSVLNFSASSTFGSSAKPVVSLREQAASHEKDDRTKQENFKQDIQKRLSNNERLILRYKTFLRSASPRALSENSYTHQNIKDIEESQIKTLSLLNKSIFENSSTISGSESKIARSESSPKQSEKKPSETKETISASAKPSKGTKERLQRNGELYKPITLLHPLKYYLQQEKAFKKKLNFYGVNQYRNFGIEKNAPYFRVMMKRFFYYYKPTLRWERTMRVATMRKARRKGSRIPRKLNINSETKALATIPNARQSRSSALSINSQSSAALRMQDNKQLKSLKNEETLTDSNNELSRIGAHRSAEASLESKIPKEAIKLNNIQKPTHFYSLVSKRASRYRYEIYKDVLQHWYYSPFNRLLLKFDVDSFIRRQPKNHFLTKKDESLLHFKRFLMSEYYNSLRWYTYMQHYDSMKTKISGTKTLTSHIYNQQFIGTFKKIRHLFAITPFSNDQTILKFDQPLYNEFSNDKNQSLLSDSVFHEEILADEDFKWIFSSSASPTEAKAPPISNGSFGSLLSSNSTMPKQSGSAFSESKIAWSENLNEELKLHRSDIISSQSKTNINVQNGQAKVASTDPSNKENETQKNNTLSAFSRSALSSIPALALSAKPKKTPIITDLKNQSADIIREYLKKSTPIREEYIKYLLNNKDYSELTKFLFRGKKLRGVSPITNEKDFLLQENNALLKKPVLSNTLGINYFHNLLWFELLKKCNNKLYDQKALKNYVLSRVDKHEKQKQRKQKNLKLRIERIKNWYVSDSSNISKYPHAFDSSGSRSASSAEPTRLRNRKSSIPKKPSLRESKKALESAELMHDSGSESSIPKKLTSNKNLLSYNGLPSSYIKAIKEAYNISVKNQKTKQTKSQKFTKSQKILLKNYLNIRLENSFNKIYKLEQNFKKTYNSNYPSGSMQQKDNISNLEKTMNFVIHRTLMPFEYLKTKILIGFSRSEDKENLRLFTHADQDKKNFLNIFKGQKDLNQWRKNETVLSRRKKIRKTLKRLRNNKNLSYIHNNYESNNLKDFKKFGAEQANSLGAERANVRKKKDLEELKRENNIPRSEKLYISRREKTWQNYTKNSQNFVENLFTKKFKKRRSRMRRYRFLKGRGPIKKRTLGEKLKGQFRFLKKYGADSYTVDSSAKPSQPLRGSESDKVKEAKESMQSSMDTNNQEKIQNKKLLIFNNLLNQKNQKFSSSAEPAKFETREIKQRRTRIRKHRFWKKHKKQKDALARRKIKKRRRYGKAKIRVLNKKLKNIKAYNDVKKWWWQEFLPSFQKNTDNVWQTLSYNDIKNELKELSIPEILERDKINPNILQIGDKDYKPLAIPEAIRIRDAYLNQMSSSLTKSVENLNSLRAGSESEIPKRETPKVVEEKMEKSNNIVDKVYTNILNTSIFDSLIPLESEIFGRASASAPPKKRSEKSQSVYGDKEEDFAWTSQKQSDNKKSPFIVATNPMPFYAGWDESSRKFVLTNRLLSREDAGYSFVNSAGSESSIPKRENQFTSLREYLKAPFNGMNAPTTLYWQIPFTTYDPDQFFALGMDGFSPIGWRNFHFKSSKQTTKPILIKKIESTLTSFTSHSRIGSAEAEGRAFASSASPTAKTKISNKFSKDLHIKFINKTLKNSFIPSAERDIKNINENRQNQINLYNRVQKRYKRVKKHPRPPVWFPSGTLANQVLPVHYIYVFYKRYRLPRDRYVRRKLRRNKNEDLKPFIKNLNQWTDYTLRKRAKPKRKYHRKNLKMKRKNEDFLTHLKRRKFRGFADETIRFRPISESQKLKELKLRRKLLTKDKKKTDSSAERKKQKVSKDNIRLRQLRRRVQRQVFRPVWRYKPQSGGFVWPGDYLRFELVKAPKLQINTISSVSPKPLQQLLFNSRSERAEGENLKVSEKQRNIRKKKRRIIQEWQVQPKKYFLQKHNLKVLKKRLQKSQNLIF